MWQRGKYDGTPVVGETRSHHPQKERDPSWAGKQREQVWHPRNQNSDTGAFKGKGLASVQDQRWSYWEGGTFGREGGDEGGKSFFWGLGISTRGQEKEESRRPLGFWANGNHSSGTICYFHRWVPKDVLSKWSEKADQMKQECVNAQSCCQALYIQHPQHCDAEEFSCFLFSLVLTTFRALDIQQLFLNMIWHSSTHAIIVTSNQRDKRYRGAHL